MNPKLCSKKFIKGFILFFVIAGLLLVFLFSMGSHLKRTDRGVTLEEYRWHTDTEPFKVYNSKRDKLLSTFLPDRIQERFFPDIKYGTLYSSSDFGNEYAFTAFFYFEGDEQIPSVRLAIGDEAGEQFEMLPDYYVSDGDRLGRYVKFSTVNLPRREKTLFLRLVGYKRGEGENVIAEFKIRNPAYGDYPVWEAEALPVSASNGGLSGELTGFTVGRSGVTERGIYYEGWNEVSFALSEDGHPTTDWLLNHLEILDATGNHLRIPFYHDSLEEDDFPIRFDATLWDSEEVWKLNAEFIHIKNFREDEIIHLRNIPVPDPKASLRLNQKFNFGDDVAVTLVDVRGREVTTSGTVNAMSGAVTLVLKDNVIAAGLRLAFEKASDDQGRTVNIADSAFGPRSTGIGNASLYSINLKVPEGAKELNIDLAITKPQVLEFLAKPEVVYLDRN